LGFLFNECLEFRELLIGKSAPFDEMSRKTMGGPLEYAFDKFANHPPGRTFLGDDGRPGGASAGTLTFDELFVEHHFEHRGDRGGSDLAFGAKSFADRAQRRGTCSPEDAQDFEFAVGGVGGGWS
jgi:hypothetical protein